MEATADELVTVEAVIDHWIRILGVGIDVFGVLIIVLGIAWSTKGFFYKFPQTGGAGYDQYRIQIGRSLMLGLEVLVAADIVKTVALELTFRSLGVLAGLVAIRTFLNWTLVLEIEGRWPWQPARAADRKGE
jgi:uncharacterized membrane protein